MKIAFVAVKGIPIGGGIEKLTEEIGTRLVKKGHEVVVYASRDYGTSDCTYNGMEIKTVPSINTKSLHKLSICFNATLDPFKEEIIYKKYYNIGIAVDTVKGLIVPVIHNTDRNSIIEIAIAIEDLAKRAREGSIQVSELQGGTFTITNVGPLGGTALIPAINYPEVAILGMGRVQEKPVVRDGEIVIRKVLPLTLSFDHRVADGADAARFVSEMVRELSDPNLLLLET